MENKRAGNTGLAAGMTKVWLVVEARNGEGTGHTLKQHKN
jgi:hypothetical protein